MKITSIRYSDSIIGSASFSFKESSLVLLYGDNYSGKSLICQSIIDAFSPSVSPKTNSSIKCKSWQIDFSIKNEICTVSINDGKISKSSLLKKHAFVDFENSVADSIVLAYGRSRLDGATELPSSLRTCYSIIYDLHKKKVKNSVVVVDDFDLGLSDNTSKKLLEHIYKNYSSRGCQLIISSSREYIVKIVENIGGHVIHLEQSKDVVQETIKNLGK